VPLIALAGLVLPATASGTSPADLSHLPAGFRGLPAGSRALGGSEPPEGSGVFPTEGSRVAAGFSRSPRLSSSPQPRARHRGSRAAGRCSARQAGLGPQPLAGAPHPDATIHGDAAMTPSLRSFLRAEIKPLPGTELEAGPGPASHRLRHPISGISLPASARPATRRRAASVPAHPRTDPWPDFKPFGTGIYSSSQSLGKEDIK